MKNTKVNKMEDAPIKRLLITMSLPAILSMLIQSMYNIVDSMFVARIGEDALTAITLVFPVQMLIIAIAVGTGIGMNSLIARSLGEKNQEKANNVASYGIILGAITGLVFAILGLTATRIFLSAFTDDAHILDMGASYLSIVMVFSIGVFTQIMIEKIFQGSGNMLFPMMTQIMGAVINIILDPIFIFGLFGFPKMGIEGAGYATITGQLCAMALNIFLLISKSKTVKIKLKGLKIDFKIIKEIYKVGFPAILMQSVTAVLIVALNGILMTFSGTAVSALGIYFKLQSFVYMPVYGLMQGAMPIMGYSYGARNKERLIHTLKFTLVLAGGVMIIGTLLFSIFPRQLIYMFDPTPAMYGIAVPALKIISIGFLLSGLSLVIAIFFQAIGDGAKSLYISLLRQLVMILPLAYVLSKVIGVVGVWIAFPISEAITIVISILFFRQKYKNDITKL